ncbi:MAG TPA: 50S ribosomal protein L3 N(5)-glutamine methyltransferase [Devosia sp.]
MTKAPSPATELRTVRDLLRYGVSRFNAARLTYGHGTSTALDEAAYLVLEGLNLPIDDLNPWLDARLTTPEREKLVGLFDARIETRKPAPYLVNRAYVRGIPFFVDERVIIPRSYLAELLLDGTLGPDSLGLVDEPGAVLDLCTGSGCLAIIAAMVFPDAGVDAVDLSPDALEVARINLDEHDLVDRIELHEGSLFSPLGKRRYDLIITNPPYVAAAEVDAFPEEYANEPQMAHLGGEDGLDLVRQILAAAPDHLNAGGGLLCEIGTGRERLEAEFDHLPFLWLDTAESEGEVFWLNAQDFAPAQILTSR